MPDDKCMTVQKVFDNWNAYLRPVDRADFMEALKALAHAKDPARQPQPDVLRLERENAHLIELLWRSHDLMIANGWTGFRKLTYEIQEAMIVFGWHTGKREPITAALAANHTGATVGDGSVCPNGLTPDGPI